MTSLVRSPIARLIVAGFALWQSGCSVARPTLVTPLSPEIGAQLGIVSVVSTSEPLKTDLAGPTRGRGALNRVLAGAGSGATSDPRTIAEWAADNASQFRADLAIAADRSWRTRLHGDCAATGA